VQDEWFKATTMSGWVFQPGGLNMSIWEMDNPGSPMACAAQDQWCNPTTGKCTGFNSYHDAGTAGVDLFQGDDLSRYIWFFYSGPNVMFGAETAIDYLGALTLTARFGLVGGVQGPLPDNQWQIEVQSWFATMLANLQMALVNTATGPTDRALDPWQLGPNSTIEREMCANQVGIPIIRIRTRDAKWSQIANVSVPSENTKHGI
jgi:hypothetical protein